MIIEPHHNSTKAGNHILVRAKHDTQRCNRIQPTLYSGSKKCLLQFILFWPERLPNFRKFIHVRRATVSDLQTTKIPEADKKWSDWFEFCLLVGKGNSLLQSRWSCASKDRVSKRFTKNSQLKAGISAFRKWSSKSLLRIVGLSLTTVSNWKSRQRQRPYRGKQRKQHITETWDFFKDFLKQREVKARNFSCHLMEDQDLALFSYQVL